MAQVVPCLVRIGENHSKYRHLPLTQDKVKIGRAPDTTYSILSTWISRYHATIEKQEDGSWILTDNKSLNGIAINGTQLEPLMPYTLKEGDVVQFGIPRTPGLEPEFVYKYFSSMKIRIESKKRSLSSDQGGEPKRLCEDSSPSVTRLQSSEEEKKTEDKLLLKLYEDQLRALTKKLEEKEEEKTAVEQQLETERQQRVAVEQIRKEQEERVSELSAKKRQLEEERAHIEEQMQQELQMRLEEQEKQLQEQMKVQLLVLATEKQDVEKRLQQEMEKAVQEKDRELQEKLREERDRLQRVIESKELQQKALENQLLLSHKENENAVKEKLKEKESILSEFATTMETELQCAICSELFVQATSLNCSHAFCAFCIKQWLGVKNECPSCRTPVTSSVRSIVLDSYIDRMVDQLSMELKERRVQLVAERMEIEAKMLEAERKATAGPSGSRRGRTGRLRGRARGRARGRGQQRRGQRAVSAAAPAPDIAATAVVTAHAAPATEHQETAAFDASIVVVTDESEESDQEATEFSSEEEHLRRRLFRHGRFPWNDDDEESEDSDDSEGDNDYEESEDSDDSEGDNYVRGEHGAYYGGYGRCFKCGSRGHWANGCPF